MPIALRKGKRTCIKHSIHNFLSHGKLSPTHHAFVSSLDEVQKPISIHEALKIPEWRKEVLEDVNAFKKNETCVVTKLHIRRRWLVASRFSL